MDIYILLENAIKWAKDFVDISEDEMTITQTKKSLLFNGGNPWTKKGDTNFDVAMGVYDGAETCDIVGLFLLSEMKDLNLNVGIYCDDGLCK